MNNAGVIKLGSLLETTDEQRDLQFDINIKGVWNVTKAVLPTLIAKQAGHICNMSSVTGVKVADPGECAYATTKAAIMGFTRAVAREVAEYGITANAILPGYVQRRWPTRSRGSRRRMTRPPPRTGSPMRCRCKSVWRRLTKSASWRRFC